MTYYTTLKASVYLECLLFISSNDVYANGVKQILEMVTKLT